MFVIICAMTPKVEAWLVGGIMSIAIAISIWLAYQYSIESQKNIGTHNIYTTVYTKI